MNEFCRSSLLQSRNVFIPAQKKNIEMFFTKHENGLYCLERSGRALRLRWPWLRWTDPHRSWVGSKVRCNDADMDLFRAATKITFGNGDYTSFWYDS
jgi:hypothetical protein